MIYALSCLVIILSYISFNLYHKLQLLEKKIEDDVSTEERAFLVYDNILKLLIRCKVELDTVDKRGSYSSDDEVGFAFRIIKGSIENLVHEIKNLSEDEETKN
jgi:hypothetical protein